MKRLIIIFATILLLFSGSVWAAGTVTQATDVIDGYQRTITFTCTGDSGDGSFPATAMSAASLAHVKGWFLLKIAVNPGATAPTVDSDLTLTDGDGIDILDGNGTDLIHNTDSKATYGQVDGMPITQPVQDAWTLTITNNSVNSAIIVIKLTFFRI